MNETLLIRRSTGEDRAAIRELAGLDSRRPPDGPVLLAFIGTELRAALPLDGQAPVADPSMRRPRSLRCCGYALSVRSGTRAERQRRGDSH